MFYLTGIVVTFFLAVILISKRGKTDADRILVLWLIVIGVHLTSFYVYIAGSLLSFPYLLGLEHPLPLLHGPLLYLYTGTVTNQVPAAKQRLLHFLPFFCSYLLLFQFIVSSPEHKVFVYQNRGLGYETETGMLLVMIFISGIVYVALSLWLLGKHRRVIRDEFSYAEKINLAWLRYLIYGIGVIWIVVIIGDDPATYSTVVVFVIILGYFGINQVGIFTQQLPAPTVPGYDEPLEGDTRAAEPILKAPEDLSGSTETPVIEEPAKTKYLKSNLSPAVADTIHSQLTKAMSEKKLFTDPELTLDDLAQKLNVHRNNLSQIINTYEKKSFYDYINVKRVEEFKRQVSVPGNQKYTLLGLANDCGFNSKTSFNRNFKNVTGLSPSEYLKQVNILLE